MFNPEKEFHFVNSKDKSESEIKQKKGSDRSLPETTPEASSSESD